MTEEMSYHEARSRSLFRALDSDPSIVLLGGGVSLPFNPDDGLSSRYADRIIWPPVSEFGVAAVGIGLALSGLRPLIPLTTASFMFYAWAPVVNEAPNIRYLSGGTASAPVVFHVMAGSRRGGGAQHEHTPQSMLQNVPGLRVYLPGTPAAIDAAFHQALTGDDPSVIVDHTALAEARGLVSEVPSGLHPTVLRAGTDVLVISSSLMTQRALAAADQLADEGLSVGVLDVPVINPLDVDGILSVARAFGVVLCIDESRASGSPATRMAAIIAEGNPGVRLRLLATADVPAPFAPNLVDEISTGPARIAREIRELLHLT